MKHFSSLPLPANFDSMRRGFIIGLLCNTVIFATFMFYGIAQYHVLLAHNTSSRTKINSESIAVCFAGNSRTFRLPLVHDNIVQNVIQPLKTDYLVKVFFILTLDDAPRSNRSQSSTNQTVVDKAIQKFEPAHVTYLKAQESFGALRRSKINHAHFEWLEPPKNCSSNDYDIARLPHTLFRSKQCLQRIVEFESKNSFRFDWMYRLRPDVVYFENIISPRFLRKDIYYSNQARTNVTHRTGKYWLSHYSSRGDGAIADQMSFSSRSLAEVTLRAWDATNECELYHMKFIPSPEDTLRFWLLKNYLRYEAIPLDWAIIRENVGPECKRLFHQHGVAPNGKRANWKESLRKCLEFGLQHQHLFPYMMNATRYLSRLPHMQRSFNEIVTE